MFGIVFVSDTSGCSTIIYLSTLIVKGTFQVRNKTENFIKTNKTHVYTVNPHCVTFIGDLIKVQDN